MLSKNKLHFFSVLALVLFSFTSRANARDVVVQSTAQGANGNNSQIVSDRIFSDQHQDPYQNYNQVNNLMEQPVFGFENKPQQQQQSGSMQFGAQQNQNYMAQNTFYAQPVDPAMAQQGNIEGMSSQQMIDIVGEGKKYTLGAEDVVHVMARNQPDFSGYFVIGPNGTIHYNWAGEVEAEGLTKEELKTKLEEVLQKYVRYPEVSVNIAEYNSKGVYVVGSVGKPGRYTMRGDSLKLRDALIQAGLPTDESALKRAKIIRNTVDGPQEIDVNLKDLLYKGELDKDFDLKDGDIVHVPMSRFVKTTEVMSRTFGPLFQAAAVYNIADDISGGND